MTKRTATATTVGRFAKRSTSASARLESRQVPLGFARSSKVAEFVESKRTKR